MKKTGLFKILIFILMAIVVITWFVPASYFEAGELVEYGSVYKLGFFDFFQLIFGSFEFKYFLQIAFFILCVGAFYGVLAKTGKYRAWIEKIANSFKGIEYVFLICVAVVLAALSSVFSYGLLLFIFIPLLIGIILSMGYDKLTAFLTTFGAVLIGQLGSTVGYNINGLLNDTIGTTLISGLVYKLLLLFIPLGFLVFYIIKAKHPGTKKASAKPEEESCGELFIGEKIANKYSVVPIIITFVLLLILLVLGCTNWVESFGVTVFETFHDKVMGVSFLKDILGSIGEFGSWYYAEMCVILLLLSLIVGKLYRLKLREIIENMFKGAGKLLPSAALIIMCYAVLYFAGNTFFYSTLAKYILGATSKFNLFFSSVSMILGSVVHVDMAYLVAYAIPQIAAQDANSTVLMLLCQGMYGVTMFIAPTSVLLALGLSYLEIPYKEWIKKTWKYILIVLAVVVAIIFAAMLIK